MKATLNTGRGKAVSPPQPTMKEWEMKVVTSLSAHLHGVGLALECSSKPFCSLAFRIKGLQWLEKQTRHTVNVFFFESTSQMLSGREDAALICWFVGGLVGSFVFCSISVHGVCARCFGSTLSVYICIKLCQCNL